MGVLLTISYHPYFLRVFRVWSMGQWGEFRVKIASFLYMKFFGIVFFFIINKFVFSFSFLFFIKYPIFGTEY